MKRLRRFEQRAGKRPRVDGTEDSGMEHRIEPGHREKTGDAVADAGGKNRLTGELGNDTDGGSRMQEARQASPAEDTHGDTEGCR